MRHHIQRSILDKLATAPSRRYSELKPAELDGNTFVYHLKALITEGYVEKTAEGNYQLTVKGRDFIVRRYEDSAQSARVIYLLVIKNGSSYLLRKRNTQPLLGYTGFVHGEPEPSVDVVTSAQHRLLLKTGLTTPLAIRGSALLTQYKNDELQSYSYAVILYGETNETSLIAGDATGTNSWRGLRDTPSLLPSCHDLVTMIERGDTWLEQTYYL